MQTKRNKKGSDGQLCLLYYQWFNHQVVIYSRSFVGNPEATGICLSPIQVSCIAFFSPLSQSSCNKSNGNAQTPSLSITWQKQFLFHYSCYNFNKNNQKSSPTLMGKVFRPWGMHMLHICGDVVLPKVTLNPTDSHKPMHYKLNNDHHRNLPPLIDI